MQGNRYPLTVEVFPDYAAMSGRAAEIVVELLQEKPDAVLGLPTGSTPLGFYDALVASGVSLAQARTFNLDEYLGLPRTHPESYYSFMKRALYDRSDLRPENCHIPDGNAPDPHEECRRYEEAIRAAGGLDILVLGVGHNGHIGFNEPGSQWDARTRVVNLAESTRRANARFFNSLDEVPRQAITMGIGTILEARRILLLASGQEKAPAVRDMVESAPTPDVPATALQLHPNVTVLLDREAAALLHR
ncbi:glucosamine-6-phosphate deaminase [Symbiobacterium terraclitae]|uniref:Glucosamine-6-phosphate deaminase n=1 Tax=Symbiobacterium terraclitae TaxID=557451 RepID=A0ABS4JPS5_9FIRM|nr:glucosamine-6-phosphate deaminase [Symbiobacterium terraclitae]MBP2017548.1 glucosamine-6-phosphate deaminase [Symbiobacterium terraclitae]